MTGPELLDEETSTDGAPWIDAWDAALRAVELDVHDAEELLASIHRGADETLALPDVKDWVAPNLLGPLPHVFSDRARALLQRQYDVNERLTEAMVQIRSQRRGLGKMDAAEARPVFLDRAL